MSTGKDNLKEMSINSLISLTLAWHYDRNMIKGSNQQAQLNKLVEELGEMATGINKNVQDKFKDGVGDMLVVLIALCEMRGTSLKECLAESYNEIKDRKGKIVDGIFIKENDQDIVKTHYPIPDNFINTNSTSTKSDHD